MNGTVYTNWGPVRGECGHLHKSKHAAVRCLVSDRAGCRKLGSYSDRATWRANSAEEMTAVINARMAVGQ
jgi:hypothetical protein